MSKRSAVHATFTLERTYAAQPERVFHAWSDTKAKARWFAPPAGYTQTPLKSDFRVGGKESISSTPPGKEPHTFDATYWDIVPNERIVYVYEMHIGAARISVSLATIEFKPAGSGTRLVLTEQGVFLDGYDDAGSRERGTRGLLDQLGAALGG
ncbi:MAG: SRPBCC family protein [Reyranellales bacterium]